MALGTGPVIPQSVNIQGNYSLSGSSAPKIQFKIIPTNPDGTPFDLTDATAISCVYTNNNQAANIMGTTQVDVTLGTHDGTGAVITFPASALAAAVVAACTFNLRISLTATDGVTSSLIGTGTINLQQTS